MLTIAASYISCGIKQVYGFTHDIYFNDATEQYNLNRVLSDYSVGGKALVIASLNSFQTKAFKFLVKNGFKQVGDWKTNPNTNSRIILLVKFMDEEGSANYSTKFVLEPATPKPILYHQPQPFPVLSFKPKKKTKKNGNAKTARKTNKRTKAKK